VLSSARRARAVVWLHPLVTWASGFVEQRILVPTRHAAACLFILVWRLANLVFTFLSFWWQVCDRVQARHTLQLKKGRNTHVVCASATGPKYDRARKWGTHTVSREWLFQSIQELRILNPFDFPVPDTHAAENAVCTIDVVAQFIVDTAASPRHAAPYFNTRDVLAALSPPRGLCLRGNQQQASDTIDSEMEVAFATGLKKSAAATASDPLMGVLSGVVVMVVGAKIILQPQRVVLHEMAERLGATVITQSGLSNLKKCTHYIFKGKTNDSLKE
jgi:hypothetical protein